MEALDNVCAVYLLFVLFVFFSSAVVLFKR